MQIELIQKKLCLMTYAVNNMFLLHMSKKQLTKRNLKILTKHYMEHLSNDTFKQKVFNYEQNKEWKYEGDLPCIIDFYADWCAPCKMIAPILEQLSEEYKGKISIYKVDTEKELELAAAFGIQSIPTLIFCPKNGQPQLVQGALPKTAFDRAIKEILLNDQKAEVEK